MYRGIIEDLPYESNRVVFDADNPSRTAFEYTVYGELRERQLEFRSMLKNRLKLPMIFLTADPDSIFRTPAEPFDLAQTHARAY